MRGIEIVGIEPGDGNRKTLVILDNTDEQARNLVREFWDQNPSVPIIDLMHARGVIVNHIKEAKTATTEQAA